MHGAGSVNIEQNSLWRSLSYKNKSIDLSFSSVSLVYFGAGKWLLGTLMDIETYYNCFSYFGKGLVKKL